MYSFYVYMTNHNPEDM